MSLDSIRKVKCCASCEYAETIDGVDIQCSAYVNRKLKIYEVCDSFYPDIDILEAKDEPR